MTRRRPSSADTAVLLALGFVACQATRDSGLEADLRVSGGVYQRGVLEEASPAGGPAVVSVFNGLTAVTPGETGKPLAGTLAAEATAVALGLRGDPGFWTLDAAPPSLDAPDLPTFAATMAFAPTTPLGDLTLVVRAVDGGGHYGDATLVALSSMAPPGPTGRLVFSLGWDTEADLDLHVVTPDGTEVWARNLNSYRQPLPGQSSDAGDWQTGGILDFDSNAGCVIDGRRQENVTWHDASPDGDYLVRIDTAALCGQSAARWKLRVLRDGSVVAGSDGIALPSDTRASKGPGSGLTVLTYHQDPS